jgi:membrane protease YdiL (CAAX protease family)
MESTSNTEPPVSSDGGRRTDPSRDGRRYAWYFGGLLVVYVAALAAFWPRGGAELNETVYLFVMFAPTVGALLARFLGPGVIWWGRPSWWMVIALLPIVAVLGAYLLGAGAGWYAMDGDILRSALTGSVVSISTAGLLAVGEEIGWRGFLWPLLRNRYSFLWASLIIGIVWWIYHVPFILTGWYGSLAGLPAFTAGIAGFTLFAGVLTDRSRSVWPSVITHSAWNGLVATSFAVTVGDVDVPAFSGSDALLGEFGWIPAVTVLVIGVGTAWWHVRSLRSGGATR